MIENNPSLDAVLAAIEQLSVKVTILSKINPDKQPSQSESLDQLGTALAKAQAEMPIAGLDASNPYFKSKYADLAGLVRASRPHLSKNGLSVIQQIRREESGQLILYTKLLNASGQWIESSMNIAPAKNDIQSLGSYITYLRRYCYAALVGVVAGNEDDDGEVAMVDARQIMAKGPSIKYDPKQSFETITKEQLEEMEYELAEYPDLAEEIMDRMKLQSLADMPKSKYQVSMQRIREIKQLRNEGVKK